MSVRVLVADDHPLYREGVSRAIEAHDELELVGQAADGGETVERTRALRPDVAVIDITMPGFDGIEVLRTLAREELPTRVLSLSASRDPELATSALAHGAAGFLVKGASRATVCEAILAVARGESVVDPALKLEPPR